MRSSFLLGALVLACALGRLPAQDPRPAAPPAIPAPDPIEGIWTGTITAPQGTTEEFGLEFVRDPGGVLGFRMHFPAMFTYAFRFGLPVSVPEAGRYRITPHFDLDLVRRGDTLTGTFGAGKMPVVLHRGGTWSGKPPPPRHPVAPAPLWSSSLGAPTWAPPVCDRGQLFIGTSTGAMQALSATGREELWRWQGGHAIDGRVVPGDTLVFFLDTAANLVALHRDSGRLAWSCALRDGLPAGAALPANPTFNHRAPTPLLLGDVLYAGSPDGSLYAIDRHDGTKLWRHDAGSPIFSGLAAIDDRTLAFGTLDGSVVLLDRMKREETRRWLTGGGVVTTPLRVGDKLIVGSRDYQLYAFNLTDGSVAWRYSYWFSWVESSPVLHAGVVYVGASDYARVTALDGATGRALWSTPVHGMGWGSPVVTDDCVYIGTVAQNLPGTVIAHEGGIVALDRRTGAVLWRHVVAQPPAGRFAGYAGTLAHGEGQIVGVSIDGEVIAFPAR